mmetsp:Transcript_15507/g.21895  ORF Transcript_15507/g.21895 Transcript_15507/m.21895 type:complete len:520 (-) Transcript_15507:157-1716(-)
MYCGDETGAFIGDVGSHTCRFGYGGEDNPKYVTPSYVACNIEGKKHMPTSCYRAPSSGDVKSIYRLAANVEQGDGNNEDKPQIDPTAYLQQGDIVQDWDSYEHAWQTSFDVLRVRDTLKHTKGGSGEQVTTTKTSAGVTSTTLRSNSNQTEGKCAHPLLAISSGCTHAVGSKNGSQYDKAVKREQIVRQTEVLMEAMEATSVFIAPTPMLAAFSHGRQTCLVVDIGAGGTRVTPVVDGLLLNQSQRRSGRGGDWLGSIQQKALQKEHITVKPRYQLRLPQSSTRKIPAVFRRWALQDLMFELRTSPHESLATWRIDPTTPFVYPEDEGKTKKEQEKEEKSKGDNAMEVETDLEHTYELPDGTIVDTTTRIGKDLLRLPELFFTDDVPFVENDALSPNNSNSVLSEHSTLSNLPLHKLIHASLTAVGDSDVRKELCGNIVLTGGSSLFSNLEQRLSLELTTVVPSSYKCRVIASRNSVERSCAAWIGASVLTSLGSFQQLWLSRTEYEEYGATLAVQRFP